MEDIQVIQKTGSMKSLLTSIVLFLAIFLTGCAPLKHPIKGPRTHIYIQYSPLFGYTPNSPYIIRPEIYIYRKPIKVNPIKKRK